MIKVSFMRKIRGCFYAETVRGSYKIDMRFMLKNGFIKRGHKVEGILEWTSLGSASFISHFSDDEKYLRLMYYVNEQKYDYRILIDEVPSNLGKGYVLYFLCPDSGRRSKVLFKAYGEHKFINRVHYEYKYGLRIYYPTQKADKRWYYNDRYHALEGKVDSLQKELSKKHRKTHYRGRPTKEQRKLNKMREELSDLDFKRMLQFAELYNYRAILNNPSLD